MATRRTKGLVDTLNFFLGRAVIISLGDTVKFTNNTKPAHSRPRPIIFIANHQSLYDIPVLIWFLRKYHAKFISKIELTKGVPSVSYNLRHGGAANIDRKDPRQSITEIMKLGTRMKEKNWSAVIFPEGTRSKDGSVKTFQAACGVGNPAKKMPGGISGTNRHQQRVENGALRAIPAKYIYSDVMGSSYTYRTGKGDRLMNW